ncbi:Auxin-responsive protein IAA26 [Acorus gramineus]|uniref:Auxin-responsive protein n=1 Tax=Acorus gramineus TaxID=55184 RepID=A0AAV9AQ69_ACOGR|nr:Auxin-responsive protein IAA26 [Acorus gramineus]
MEGDSKKGDVRPQLLNLISKERDWSLRDLGGGHRASEAEEKKLELRLGPPGEDYPVKQNPSFSKAPKSTTTSAGAKRVFLETVETNTEGGGGAFQSPSAVQKNQPTKPGFLQFQRMQGLERLESQPEMKSLENKASKNGALNNNSSQTRTSSVPVVGWPPIRSFRRNITGSSSKVAPPISQNGDSKSVEKVENSKKGLFVKINMDGVPIGRKVDLKAYDSYEKLSVAVDELFRGLLAAQKDPTEFGNQSSAEERQAITGLLDGSGEYTLVYEDNEGDRMLVGDVPWHMFTSTAKRLRVLKSSELPALSLVAPNRKKILAD